MASALTNKEVCKSFLTCLSHRQFEESLAFLDEQVEWWVQGTWPVPSTHHGKDGVRFLLEALDGALAGDLTIAFGYLTAEADRVAVEMTSSAPLKDGGHYNMTYHYLFHLSNGLIIRAKEYLDTQHLAASIFL